MLKSHFPPALIANCRDAFWPVMTEYLERNRLEPNRGPHRHFIPIPFERPCFATEFFFDPAILEMVRGAMGDRIVADQWGCDVSLRGSIRQVVHVDYLHPLFAELPDLSLPTYMLLVSLGLIDITPSHGPIEIAPGTHRMPREEALRAVESGKIRMEALPLAIGDVLIRHPWAVHRGTPNVTDEPRPLVTIRYVRRWYADYSRDVNAIPLAVWNSLTGKQQSLMRFPIGDH